MGDSLGYIVYQKVVKPECFEDETSEAAGSTHCMSNREVQVVGGDVPGHILRQLVKDLAGTIASVIVSHPFMVVTARMFAQFVGRESLYE
ncbi:mitochondrial carrier homolog 2-like isoform X4 [Artemia franciscana]|uniref:Uncharacterized protein n=1 Tax=Artemia franciscana TaxID=6661 RepID=A0AA88L1C4_ARTSF|nr:hypothetical protein QYM36_010069 [Artemia franciscana]KAK2715303.1 hypothetical protein QYM36_010069 [Artemia franciscana]